MDKSAHTFEELLNREFYNPARPLDSYTDHIEVSSITPDMVRKFCVPMLGAETIDPFGKYGHTVCGICDGWVWHHAVLDTAPEIDLWKMTAIANSYWMARYQRYYREERDAVGKHRS